MTQSKILDFISRLNRDLYNDKVYKSATLSKSMGDGVCEILLGDKGIYIYVHNDDEISVDISHTILGGLANYATSDYRVCYGIVSMFCMTHQSLQDAQAYGEMK